MRDFFITSLEKLITVLVVLMCIAVVVGTVVTLFSGQPGSFFAAIGVLIFGGIYAILMGGLMYLFLGIYDNTKRTAQALERMASEPRA